MKSVDLEYLNLQRERAQAERDYRRMLERRAEIAAKKVLNEDRRGRFLLRLDRDIQDMHQQIVKLDLAMEGHAHG